MITATAPAQKTHTGTMHTLDRTGDVRVMWDSGNPDEVAAARAQFDELVKRKKYVAYRAEGKDGHQGEHIREFDPHAERIILVRQNKAG